MKNKLQSIHDAEYPVVVSFVSTLRGHFNICYCIRKKSHDDIFKCYIIGIYGDIIEMVSESNFLSIHDVQSFIDETLRDFTNIGFVHNILLHVLQKCDNIVYVTRGLTILYVDSKNNLNVSKILKDEFHAPNLVLSNETLKLFEGMGLKVYV